MFAAYFFCRICVWAHLAQNLCAKGKTFCTMHKKTCAETGANMIKRWKKLNLTVQIMIGLAIGVILGFIIPKSWTGVIKASQTIGTIYMNALKMMIYPLVFCSLVCGIRSMGSVSATGRIAGRAMVFFLSTTCLACVFACHLICFFFC